MKTVLIIGASGFLGKELYKVFKLDNKYQTYGTYSKNNILDFEYLDVTNLDNINNIFQKIKPDIVIITMALTNVEYCEVNRKEAYNINVGGIKNLSKISKIYDCKVVYVSTEYVFDGNDGPYDETYDEAPINYYGKTKFEGEKIIQSEIKEYMIARTTVVYGWDLDSKNFIMQFIKNLSQNKTMKIPTDQISSPTYCPNLAKMIKESCDKGITGIFNMVGSNVMDRYNFALKAAEILDLNQELLIPIETKTLGQIAKRPLNAGLKVDKISKILYNKPISVSQGLIKVKKLYDKYKAEQCEEGAHE